MNYQKLLKELAREYAEGLETTKGGSQKKAKPISIDNQASQRTMYQARHLDKVFKLNQFEKEKVMQSDLKRMNKAIVDLKVKTKRDAETMSMKKRRSEQQQRLQIADACAPNPDLADSS